jgi:hypothetical protein
MKVTKRIYFIIAIPVLFLLALSWLLVNPVLVKGAKAPPIPVKRDNLNSDVKYLTALNPSRNSRNIVSMDRAAAYILGEFRKTGFEATTQEFSVGKKKYRNIICRFGPAGADRVIIGAHYDVCYDQPGADDNASGVAGLLELARLFGSEKPALKHRFELVAYALEEPPYFKTDFMGSAVHAKSVFESGAKVRAVVCLEMIGFFSDLPGSQRFPNYLLRVLYPSRGNYIAIVGKLWQRKLVRDMKTGMIKGSALGVRSVNSPVFLPGVDFSDHLNYWKYGYEAVMVTDTSFYRNPNYHQKSDTADTLDYSRMSEVVKGLYCAVIGL